jgi:hypothetical protein
MEHYAQHNMQVYDISGVEEHTHTLWNSSSFFFWFSFWQIFYVAEVVIVHVKTFKPNLGINKIYIKVERNNLIILLL